MRLQIRPRKGTRELLPHNLFTIPRLQLVELFGQLGSARKEGSAFGRVVDDVHDAAGLTGVAVLLQQGGDGLARGGDVPDGELAFCILVLGVDDDEGAVGG